MKGNHLVTKPVLFMISGLLLLSSSLVQAVEDERWKSLRAAYFGDRPISVSEDVISMDAPKRAHDASTVPITVHAVNPEQQLRQVHLIVDKNPLPLAGVFKFTEEAGGWESFETRIRINEYTTVRAIGELEDGSLHMTSRFIKAAGGCSAPAMADLEAALARAGKMKLLIDDINNSTAISSATAQAVIKISHPNNSGMQFDQVSRNYIPAFFVSSIVAELNGKKLLEVDTNFSLSENPMLRLNFSPDVDHTDLAVYAMDSKGNRYEQKLSFDAFSTRNSVSTN